MNNKMTEALNDNLYEVSKALFSYRDKQRNIADRDFPAECLLLEDIAEAVWDLSNIAIWPYDAGQDYRYSDVLITGLALINYVLDRVDSSDEQEIPDTVKTVMEKVDRSTLQALKLLARYMTDFTNMRLGEVASSAELDRLRNELDEPYKTGFHVSNTVGDWRE